MGERCYFQLISEQRKFANVEPSRCLLDLETTNLSYLLVPSKSFHFTTIRCMFFDIATNVNRKYDHDSCILKEKTWNLGAVFVTC